jgi:hypothetical protein
MTKAIKMSKEELMEAMTISKEGSQKDEQRGAVESQELMSMWWIVKRQQLTWDQSWRLIQRGASGSIKMKYIEKKLRADCPAIFDYMLKCSKDD